MLYVPSVTLDYYSAGGCDLRKRRKIIEQAEVKKKSEDLIGKPEECRKIGQMRFSPSVPVQSGFHWRCQGPRSPRQHSTRKSLEPTCIGRPYTVLDHQARELPFEGYQTGSVGQRGRKGIPKTNSLGKKAVFIVVS